MVDMRTGTWRSSLTCACFIEWMWDEDDPEQRTNAAKRTVFRAERCSEHVRTTEMLRAADTAAELQVLRDQIIDENHRHGAMLEAARTRVTGLTRADGSIDFDKVSWSFDRDRKLHVSFPTATAAQRLAVVAAMPEKWRDRVQHSSAEAVTVMGAEHQLRQARRREELAKRRGT